MVEIHMLGTPRWAAVEDAGRLRDALGVTLPPGVPEAFLAPVDDPLGELALRYARTHAPFTGGELAAALGLAPAVARDVVRRLAAAGRLVEGDLRPAGWEPVGGAVHGGPLYCDARVLQVLRRRSVAALRDAVEPVSTRDFARFLPSWQNLGELSGVDGVLRAVEQLAGVQLPASALESLVLPARVPGYRPGLLDELTAGGDVVWQGHGGLAGGDGWVSLHPADGAESTLAAGDASQLSQTAALVWEVLAGGGGYFFRALSEQTGINDDPVLTAQVERLRATYDELSAAYQAGKGGHDIPHA